MLLTLSVSAGVCVSYACTVTSVTPPVVSSQRVRVGSLSHGILEFDIVVGADGAESVVRPVVCNEPEQEQEQDVESEMSVFT